MADEFVEKDAPAVLELARELRLAHPDTVTFAQAAFEWVRDEVMHSLDAQDARVTLTATEVLTERVGLCFAKSHLLAAILRAEAVPAGLCYQRLVDRAGGHVLHGLVAMYVNGGWHRQDPRGNRPGIDAQFSLTEERLAYRPDSVAGEVDYTEIYVHPVATVVQALRGADDAVALCAGELPTSLD